MAGVHAPLRFPGNAGVMSRIAPRLKAGGHAANSTVSRCRSGEPRFWTFGCREVRTGRRRADAPASRIL